MEENQSDLLQGNVLQGIKQFFTVAVTKLPFHMLGENIDFSSGSATVLSDAKNFKNHVEKLVNDLQEALAAEKKQKPHHMVNPAFVQITASKSELDKRIQAFITHAQDAVDEQNKQEFSYDVAENHTTSYGCARTHAVYKRRPKTRTHMQVSHVVNAESPEQQQRNQCGKSLMQTSAAQRRQQTFNSPMEERLHNLETHARLKPGESKSVYERIKSLEQRILQLESISPEYFASSQIAQHDDQPQPVAGGRCPADSLSEIDDRIRELKQQLKKRPANFA